MNTDRQFDHSTSRNKPLIKQSCVDVIIPTFNEAKTLRIVIERVLRQPCVRDVIVVDDGSTDCTSHILKSLCEQHWLRLRVIVHRENRGKGAAIRSGLPLISAPVIVIQDADLEYDPEDFEKMLFVLVENKADVVYGTRFAGVGRRSSVSHFWGNKLLTWITNRITHLHLTDEATCYKMFRTDLLKAITLKENGFGFCPEITAKLSVMRARFCEIPISYHPRTRREGKKIRLTDGFSAIWCLIQYGLWRRFGATARPETPPHYEI